MTRSSVGLVPELADPAPSRLPAPAAVGEYRGRSEVADLGDNSVRWASALEGGSCGRCSVLARLAALAPRVAPPAYRAQAPQAARASHRQHRFRCANSGEVWFASGRDVSYNRQAHVVSNLAVIAGIVLLAVEINQNVINLRSALQTKRSTTSWLAPSTTSWEPGCTGLVGGDKAQVEPGDRQDRGPSPGASGARSRSGAL